MSNENIKEYLATVNAPWGKLFYELAWHNIECENKRILDFGSGFGITANHFAENNSVIAVEPNLDMLEYRSHDNDYEQRIGGIEQLNLLTDHSFDMIICHNVLEYLDNRSYILREFSRLIKHDGIVSLIKHNKAGKIMQKAVFEYNIEETLKLIEGENLKSENFGVIQEYAVSDLEEWCKERFVIAKTYGIRMFYGLQRNDFKTGEEWMSNMYKFECKAEEVPELRDVAFFHHIILKPLQSTTLQD